MLYGTPMRQRIPPLCDLGSISMNPEGSRNKSTLNSCRLNGALPAGRRALSAVPLPQFPLPQFQPHLHIQERLRSGGLRVYLHRLRVCRAHPQVSSQV